MTNCIVYVHGKGGNTAESKHYEGLFPGSKVIGLEYQNDVPWKVNEEIFSTVNTLKKEYKEIILIANSIGAYFSMHAGIDGLIKKAYFISPIVDIKGMIQGLMKSIALSEEELKIKGRVATPLRRRHNVGVPLFRSGESDTLDCPDPYSLRKQGQLDAL